MTFIGHFLFGLLAMAVLLAIPKTKAMFDEFLRQAKTAEFYTENKEHFDKNEHWYLLGMYIVSALLWPLFVVYYGYTRYKKHKGT